MSKPDGENNAFVTLSLCPLNSLNYSPVSLSQILTVSSLELDTNYFPSFEKLTLVTPLECPFKVFSNKPEFISQILIVLSHEEDAM